MLIAKRYGMHTALDCIPCFARQTLDAARFVTDDPQGFLFKAKCAVIAEHVGVSVGTHVATRRPATRSSTGGAPHARI